jgi:hypothetical protein
MILDKLLKEAGISKETFDKLVELSEIFSDAVEIKSGEKGYSLVFKKDVTIYIEK